MGWYLWGGRHLLKCFLFLLSLLKVCLFRASRSRSQLTHSTRDPEEYRALMSPNSDPLHLLSSWKPPAQSNLGCAVCADSDSNKHRDIKALWQLLVLLVFSVSRLLFVSDFSLLLCGRAMWHGRWFGMKICLCRCLYTSFLRRSFFFFFHFNFID